MSEYTEKHTVAKLIGSPAGYIGYEDGGLLTDAIRKTPHCVLLLDEIEKAHQDIYNILLQVMDYARLTDNKGRKADFRNVILIMTSNAGAQFAGQANIGFTGGMSRGEAMLKQVKKTFKPEFINRLSGTVVFNDMDHPHGRADSQEETARTAGEANRQEGDADPEGRDLCRPTERGIHKGIWRTRDGPRHQSASEATTDARNTLRLTQRRRRHHNLIPT
jgi:ATP-dependent Clp protease ATP-binding subunit ClpA